MSQINEEKQGSKKKVLIETWGCQMNVADSENMLNMLQKRTMKLRTRRKMPI